MSSADSAARRARWLAELADALDEARRVMKQLAFEEIGSETMQLCARIDAARLEVDAMRLKRSPGDRQDFGPEWSKDVPWKLSA
ncbi:MAG: hypothetical protein HOP95_00965 [Sphingomonas sp.]|nr:hypothetical protein [Sphingomonas sp.]